MDAVKNITFKQQWWAGIVVLVLCFALAMVTRLGILYNTAWVLIGLSFVLHPVCPEAWKWRYGDDDKRIKRDFRIAGAVVILFGLMIRFGV